LKTALWAAWLSQISLAMCIVGLLSKEASKEFGNGMLVLGIASGGLELISLLFDG